MATTFSSELANEYQFLFDTCIIKPEKDAEVENNVNKIFAHQATYEAVAKKLNMPWYFIAIIHCMEGSLNFNTHLHNGDPLTARTVQVPASRPLTGNPPFTWEESAIDALTLEGFASQTDWSIPAMLFAFEKFNGFGSRGKGINSPYLWSYSNQYTKGKFVKDHVFDPEAISKQCGAAVLLKRILEKQHVLNNNIDKITLIKQTGEKVAYDPQNFHEDASQLQELLNSVGEHLKVDGFAGRNTSDAYHAITGEFLHGDPQH